MSKFFKSKKVGTHDTPPLRQRTLWRIEILVILVLIPVALLYVYLYIQQRNTIVALARDQAERNLSIAVAEQTSQVNATEQVLKTVASSNQIFERQGCNQYLATLLETLGAYANLGVIDTSNGMSRCDGLNSQPTYLGDRLYFKSAIETRRFAVGEYQIGRLTGKRSINFGYPVITDNNVSAVVFAALDLEKIAQNLSEFQAGAGRSIIMVDKNGNILARAPEFDEYVGKNIAETDLYKTVILANNVEQSITGLDGVERLYSVRALQTAAGDDVFIAAGEPIEQLLEPANRVFRIGITVLVIILLVSAALAWVLGKILVVNYVTEINKAKEEFVSLASHQLRTPATGVKQFIGMLRDGYAGKLTEEQIKFVNKAYEANDQQLRIIQDLLNVGRLDQGRLELVSEPTNLSEFIAQAVEALRPQASQKGLDLRYTKPQGAVSATVDKDKLRMCLDNLIDNAIKYTEKGSIEVKLLDKGTNIMISVTDTGAGIAEKDIPRLFAKFSRLKAGKQREKAGTGLGLYLVKEIIRLHDGHITAKSRLGQGTSFIIELPKKGEP